MTRLILLSAACVIASTNAQWYWQTNSLFEKVRQDPELNGFDIILGDNETAEDRMNAEDLTVFAPENPAFRRYKGELYSELSFYHMSPKAMTVEEIKSHSHLDSVLENGPPLWVTSVEDDVYVNDAKVLSDKCNEVFRSRDGRNKQILHTIDGVLSPMIRSPKFSPNAYDFISNPFNWDLGTATSATSFFSKVQDANLQYIFKQPSGHTFFVPLNFGIDSYKFGSLDRNVIFSHVVPYYVLFSRPTKRDFAYETLANDEPFYVVVSFVEKNKKLYVKAMLKRHRDYQEFYSEVIVRNIPVRNGVVHLISQPLCVTNRPLKPFPYLPIASKLGTDPEIGLFYRIGEMTEFNKIFQRRDVSFTYFVPRDSAFRIARSIGLDTIEDDLTILKRHLILSETPYSIEQLEADTRANNNTFIELGSEGGALRIMVLKIEDTYYVKWQNKYIEVVRPNYECSDGIVHILAGPMANFRRNGIGMEDNGVHVGKLYLKVMKKAWEKV